MLIDLILEFMMNEFTVGDLFAGLNPVIFFHFLAFLGISI
jgi:hypothetical protein